MTRRMTCNQCGLVDAQPKHVGEVIEWYCPIHKGKIAEDLSPKNYGEIKKHAPHIKKIKRAVEAEKRREKTQKA